MGRALLILGALCSASSVAASPRFIWEKEELKADLATRVSAEELAEIEVPYEIDEPIRAWARAVTAGVADDPARAEVLARAIVRDEGLHAAYDASTTISAREVFKTGKANCISLTNLFVGIARDLGMRAYYVDVTEATHVTLAQDLLVAQGHICAGVHFPQRFVLYDFADQPERAYKGYRLLDDREALATFLLARTLNQALRPHPPDEVGPLLDRARRDADLALKIKPDFAKAYVNLGGAYLKKGERAQALDLFRRAIAIDPRLVAAHLALGYVYAQDGDWKAARAAYDRAQDILPSDPYVLYHKGVAELRDGDLDRARKTLRAALDRDPTLREAWSALGVVLRGLHDEAGALDAFAHASADRTISP